MLCWNAALMPPNLPPGATLCANFPAAPSPCLTDWCREVLATSIVPLRNIVQGLQADFGTVLAALAFECSNDQTEGQVNRLKYLKRQMYGRAKFDLLHQRVLYAA